MSSANQDLMRNWANTHGKCVTQRTVRQETTKYKAGTLPMNIYQTAVHRGERLYSLHYLIFQSKRKEKARLHRGTQETISLRTR